MYERKFLVVNVIYNFEKTCLKSVDLMNFRVEYVRPRSEADDEVKQILKKQDEGFQKVHV